MRKATEINKKIAEVQGEPVTGKSSLMVEILSHVVGGVEISGYISSEAVTGYLAYVSLNYADSTNPEYDEAIVESAKFLFA